MSLSEQNTKTITLDGYLDNFGTEWFDKTTCRRITMRELMPINIGKVKITIEVLEKIQ